MTDVEIIAAYKEEISKPQNHYVGPFWAMLSLVFELQEANHRLKAENRNVGQKILNQRKQLKACNEKIKRLEVDNENIFSKAIPLLCDKYCRYPLECQSQEELDEHCDNCDFIKILNLKERNKENEKLHRT